MAWYSYSGSRFLSEDNMDAATEKLVIVLYNSLPEGMRNAEVMESVLEHTKEKIQTCEIMDPSHT